MHFSTAVIATTAALLSTAAAEGIFAINGTGNYYPHDQTTQVTLRVENGLVGDPPTCSGTVSGGNFPTTGNIPCQAGAGYALSYSWPSADAAIAATYTDPSNSFTYNVPNNNCVDVSGTDPYQSCTFGFQDLFSRRMRRGLRA